MSMNKRLELLSHDHGHPCIEFEVTQTNKVIKQKHEKFCCVVREIGYFNLNFIRFCYYNVNKMYEILKWQCSNNKKDRISVS